MRSSCKPAAHASGETAAVAEMNRYDAIGLSRHDPERDAQPAALLRDDVDGGNVMFASFDGSAAVVAVCDLAARYSD